MISAMHQTCQSKKAWNTISWMHSNLKGNTTMLMDTMIRKIIMTRNTTISWNMMKTTCPSSKRWTRMIPWPWPRKWLRKKG